MNEPIYVVFWPYFKGLRERVVLLEKAFPRQLCTWIENFDDFHFDDLGAVVIINGSATDISDMQQLDQQIENFKWALLISIGDEGSGQHLEWIEHPNVSIWVQESKPGKHDKFHRMPVGPLLACSEWLPKFKMEMEKKSVDWFFSGSERTADWGEAIRSLSKDTSKIFLYYSYHLCDEDYMRNLASAKVVPCRPSLGIPETCRVYDALEAGCVPIVSHSPGGEMYRFGWNWSYYWEYVLGEVPPFPVISNPDQLADAMKNTLDNWFELSEKVQAWWKNYKVRLTYNLREEVKRLKENA